VCKIRHAIYRWWAKNVSWGTFWKSGIFKQKCLFVCKLTPCACARACTGHPTARIQRTCDINCYFGIKNICTLCDGNLALTTCTNTRRVTQLYLKVHLTWAPDQLDMYISWHRFYCESAVAVIGKFKYVFKNTSCQKIFKLEIKIFNWYDFM